MRIVYLVLGKDIAGGETVCLQQMRAARERGHEVCLLVPAKGSTSAQANAEGFEVLSFPLERTFHLHRALLLALLLRRWRADLVHTHTGLPGMVLARIGAFLARVPIICHLHLDHNFNRRPLIAYIQRRVDNLSSHLCQIIAVSEDTRRRLVASGNPPGRIQVIPNGIREASESRQLNGTDLRETLGLSETAVLVGCVARLDPIKGQTDLIQATQQIIQACGDASLVLVGADIAAGGAYEHELRMMVNSCGVSEKVHFIGFQPNAAELINDFDIFVLPSYREAMPMTILEAMAAGKPVVATCVNGVPEVVVDGVTGVLVEPGDVRGLADAIIALLRDNELAQRIGDAGRQRVREHFSLETLHERLFEVYDEVTAKGHG